MEQIHYNKTRATNTISEQRNPRRKMVQITIKKDYTENQWLEFFHNQKARTYNDMSSTVRPFGYMRKWIKLRLQFERECSPSIIATLLRLRAGYLTSREIKMEELKTYQNPYIVTANNTSVVFKNGVGQRSMVVITSEPDRVIQDMEFFEKEQIEICPVIIFEPKKAMTWQDAPDNSENWSKTCTVPVAFTLKHHNSMKYSKFVYSRVNVVY